MNYEQPGCLRCALDGNGRSAGLRRGTVTAVRPSGWIVVHFTDHVCTHAPAGARLLMPDEVTPVDAVTRLGEL